MVLRRIRTLFVIVTALLLLSSPALPGNAQDEPIGVAAGGLTAPRGLAFGEDGTLYVAEAGTGADDAGLAWIGEGCAVQLVKGLPSRTSDLLGTVGAAGVAILGDDLYLLTATGNDDYPRGLYRVAGSGDVTLIADLGAVTPPIAIDTPRGDFSDLAVAKDGSSFVVLDGEYGQVLRITPDGEISLVAGYYDADSLIPSAIATGPDGKIYVAELPRGVPAAGGATVSRYSPDNLLPEIVWSGLTAISGLAVDDDGQLYALETATAIDDSAPFFASGTGELVRQTGERDAQRIATDLDLPSNLAIGPDGAFYVSVPAIDGNGSGRVLRIASGQDESVSALDLPTAPKACVDLPIEGSPAAATPEASEIVINIFDFGFDQAMVEIPVGTTVTWVNTGAVEHTVVSFDRGKKVWDSNIMEPGARYSYTFEKPGQFDYVCGLHPSMKATIVVTD
jgi:plastocyanin/sugar lactone lactonase YvrE